MRTCLICPVPSLDKYVDEKADHHLLLAHLLDDPRYVEFYRARSESGDYVILDNGAKELGAGLGMKLLLEGAQKVKAKEVVLTDVRYRAAETVRAAQTGLAWLMSLKGREAYEAAGFPKLMLVPQGKTPMQWFDCLAALLTFSNDCMAIIDEMPEPCVAYAYHYDHMFRGGLPKLIAFGRPSFDIHLLGWTRRLGVLAHIAEQFPEIRSVDSGRPFSYAKAGIACTHEAENPGRDENFFTEPIPDDRDKLVRANIATFRQYAQDVRAVGVPGM